jgi:Protein of unknown function (DUF3631)
VSLPYPPPPDDLDGARVLDGVAAFVGRYVVFPTPHALTVITLWAAHTHAPEKTWYVTPRLVLDSAEPGSGKTRVLELLALLVQRPEMTISATVAAIFRMIAEEPLTLLFDEVDAIFNPKNGGNYEDLRALLNAGYKQGATIARCVGDAKQMKVQRFDVFAPVALAGLAGKMPATITTRAVTVHMRRRAPGEKVQPFRERDAEYEAEPIREQLATWIGFVATDLADARPEMPKGVEDRPAEVWEALLAVADAAGGEWPARAREACRYFVLNADPGELSLGVRLLRDVRKVFRPEPTEDEPNPVQHGHMATAALVEALVNLDESPWADLYGKPLTALRLAKEMERYGVRPIQFRDGEKQRGYVTWGTDKPEQTGLADAWTRYLHSGGTAGTPGTAQVGPVPGADRVPGQPGTAPQPGTGLTSQVPLVPDVPQESGPRVALSGKCSLCGLTVPGPFDDHGRCPQCTTAATKETA